MSYKKRGKWTYEERLYQEDKEELISYLERRERARINWYPNSIFLKRNERQIKPQPRDTPSKFEEVPGIKLTHEEIDQVISTGRTFCGYLSNLHKLEDTFTGLCPLLDFKCCTYPQSNQNKSIHPKCPVYNDFITRSEREYEERKRKELEFKEDYK